MANSEITNRYQKIFSVFLLDDFAGRRLYVRNVDGSEIIIQGEAFEVIPDVVLDQFFNELDTQIIFSNGTTELYVQFGTTEEDPLIGNLVDFIQEPFI